MARITITPSGRVVTAETGDTLHHALIAGGVPVDAPCGGRGVCGQCRVRAAGELEEPDERELGVLGGRLLDAGYRLACRARIAGDVEVEVRGLPAAAPMNPYAGLGLDAGLDLEEPSEPLGLAVDLGTTSIAGELVDLATGTRLGRASLLNPQTAHGADVLSRVSFAVDGGLTLLIDEVRGAVASIGVTLLARLGEPGAAIAVVVAVGNPVMLHLFAGEDPAGLGTAPYTPVFLEERVVPAGSVPGLPAAQVILLPSAGPFLGADAVAAALAAGVAPREGAGVRDTPPAMLVDLGTNGELVLASEGRLYGASAAAGPAFEAVGLASGMRAVPGAIDRVDVIDDDLAMRVIGGIEPVGLCGSGFLDAVAAARALGLVDAQGRLTAGPQGPASARVRQGENGLELVLWPSPLTAEGREGEQPEQPYADVSALAAGSGHEVCVTQLDIRALQLAQGAVATGIGFLLREAGLTPDAPVRLVEAGAFGAGVRPATARALGMFPAPWTERMEQAGDAALEGAIRALAEPRFRADMTRVAGLIETLDLAALPGFQEEFLASLALEPWGAERWTGNTAPGMDAD